MGHLLTNHSNIENFLLALSRLPDTRDKRGKRHSLVYIIAAVIFAILAGRSKTSSLHRYIQNKIIWLRQVLQMYDIKPISRAHLPRLLDGIDWNALNWIMMAHFNLYLLPTSESHEWIAIDGKVMRGTLKSGEKQAIIHAVTHDSRTEVAQIPQSGSKSSEIPVVRTLLKDTGLEKEKITLDAHHCNPQTTSQIALAGGIYLTQVKENQPILLKQCRKLDIEESYLFTNENTEKAHGRLTSRLARIYSMDMLPLDQRWNDSNIQTLVVMERETLHIKSGKTSKETSYYISNFTIENNNLNNYNELIVAVRKHWGVESNNWILDVTFNEDKVITKYTNQSHIMGRLRGFAIQLLRKAGMKNFQAATELFTDSVASLESMLRKVKFL